MKKVPYILCTPPSLVTIDLRGTVAAQKLNWDGQLLTLAINKNVSKKIPIELSIQPGCMQALKDSLVTLSLANNRLGCRRKYTLGHFTWNGNIASYKKGTEHIDHLKNYHSMHRQFMKTDSVNTGTETESTCDFRIVKELRKLSYLNLRNNSITDMRLEMYGAVAHIIENNTTKSAGGISGTGGVSLESNRIDNLYFPIVRFRKCLEFTSNFLLNTNTCIFPFFLFPAFFDVQLQYGRQSQAWFDMAEISAKDTISHIIMRYTNLQAEDLPALNWRRFPSLKVLDLSRNALTNQGFHTILNTVPTSLQRLNLEGNSITKLESTKGAPIIELPNLLRLELETQGAPYIFAIESGFFKRFPLLQQLYFKHSLHLPVLEPHNFEGLVNLRQLEMRNCHIDLIKKDAFRGLKKLISLRLHTYMENDRDDDRIYQPGCFNDLINLQELTVFSTMQVDSLASNMFEGLENLRKLDLQRSRIGTIKTNAFLHLINLKTLVMSYMLNTIAFEQGCFNGLKNLEYLEIDNKVIVNSNFEQQDFTPVLNCDKICIREDRPFTVDTFTSTPMLSTQARSFVSTILPKTENMCESWYWFNEQMFADYFDD